MNEKENVSDKATEEWLQSQKPSTRSGYKTYWRYFVEYVKMDGEQILADRKSDKEHKWERIVLQFKQWLMDEKKLSQYTATTAAMAVRGFFAFHYNELEYRKAESKKLSEHRLKTEDYRFNRDDLKKMTDVGDLTEKYVITAGKSLGLRAGDFLALRRGDVEPYLEREPPVSIGKLTTGKEKIPAYPFLDADALPLVKLMIQKMNREGRTKPTDRILTWHWEKALSKVVKRLVVKAGINTGTQTVRFHCLRKFLCDHLASHMSESKWKQIVGKKIDEKAYVSPDSLREDYQRAIVETCFTKAVTETEMELLAKKQALIMLAKLQGTTEDEIKKIFRQRKTATVKDEVKTLEELTERKTATNGGDCVGKQCIVSEDELPKLLAEGWHATLVLPSGKVVLQR